MAVTAEMYVVPGQVAEDGGEVRGVGAARAGGGGMRWPDYLVERALQVPGPGLCVVAGSTPVVAFGDPVAASVATLGINPSGREFLDGAGGLLGGRERRLATLASFDVGCYEDLTPAHGESVVDECASYFERRPYGRWFDPLDRVLRGALGVSYHDRTACHLDLVQWATDPVWSGLGDGVRNALLRQDAAFLRRQLARPDLRLVVVNGGAVVDQTQALGLVRWRKVDTLSGPPVQVLVGEANGTRFVGWTCNLQSTPGALRHESRLTELVAAHAAIPRIGTPPRTSPLPRRGATPAKEAVLSGTQANDELMPKGQRYATKRDLLAGLEAWLGRSSADTVGDTSRYKGKPWLFIDSPAGRIRIHADTTRAGIEALVAAARTARSYDWLVVANDRGRINKVLFCEERTPGWYAYLTEPLDQEGPIGDGC